jgi:hypothetical protein
MAAKNKTDRDLDKFRKDVALLFKKIQNKNEMTIIGEDAIDIIRERTTSGKGVHKPGGNRVTLRDVSPEYAKRREKIKRKSRLAAKGTKCNLTLYGSMLRNLSVIHATKSEVVVGHTGEKNQAKTLAHHNSGREFLFLGKAEIKLVIDLYDKRISSKARKV